MSLTKRINLMETDDMITYNNEKSLVLCIEELEDRIDHLEKNMREFERILEETICELKGLQIRKARNEI